MSEQHYCKTKYGAEHRCMLCRIERDQLREEIARIQHAAERHRDLAAERLAEIQRMQAVVAAARNITQAFTDDALDKAVDGLRSALKNLESSDEQYRREKNEDHQTYLVCEALLDAVADIDDGSAG